METAKVDVRKLQMLNDRINQTIDALNQVRLSVHGMSSNGTAYTNGTTPFNTFNTPFTTPFTTPFNGAFSGVNIPFGVPGAVPGLGWTHPAHVQALQHLQQLQQLQQAYGVPFAQSFGTTTPFAQTFGANPFPGINPINTIGGINNAVYADPFVGNRIAQTFPFVQWGYSPLASGSWPSASQMS